MRYRMTILLSLLALSCSLSDAADNSLSQKEKQAGWILLFDGRTTNGWTTIEREPLPMRHVDHGALNPHPCDYMLLHEKLWGNFVLSLDLKLSPGCNSGIFFRTWPLQVKPGKDIGWNGLEIAIDDTKTAGFHDTGAIYDLVRPKKNAMKPIGQWNRIVLTCRNNRITVEVNGEMVSRMDLDRWTEPGKRPDGSDHKFTGIAYKNHPRRGYIGLQDHGQNCWYKNIKLRKLK